MERRTIRREDAAAALGISRTTLRRREQEQGIEVRREGRAAVLDAADVDRLRRSGRTVASAARRRDPGDVAACAWLALDSGAPWADLVVSLRITPETAHTLAEQWAAAREAVTLGPDVLAQLRAAGYVVRSGGEVVRVIAGLVSEVRRLRRELGALAASTPAAEA